MLCRARRPRRNPLPMLLGGFVLAATLATVLPSRAADDPLDTLAGPPSSRFT